MLSLGKIGREQVVGADIKDLLYSVSFERSMGHKVPFTADGSENTLMLKLADGSFIPVRVRAIELSGSPEGEGGHAHRYVVAIRSLEEQYAYDRKTQRLLSELKAANKRLSGTLSVIMSTVGSNDMPTLLDTVLNRMAETLDAAGTTIYFAESGGFKLRGVSRGLMGSRVPAFIPYGAGVATHVLREQRRAASRSFPVILTTRRSPDRFTIWMRASVIMSAARTCRLSRRSLPFPSTSARRCSASSSSDGRGPVHRGYPTCVCSRSSATISPSNWSAW